MPALAPISHPLPIAVGLMCMALVPLVSVPAQGTTVVEMDLPALCDESELAFSGTVTSVTSQWADPERKRMETLVTFAQLTPLLGDPGEEITLRFPGGEIDGVREQVAGLPSFAVGDRVVLLVGDGRSVSPIVGFQQGLFRVVDGRSGPLVLNAGGRSPDGGSGGGLDDELPDAPREEGVALEAFLNVLRQEFDRRTREH